MTKLGGGYETVTTTRDSVIHEPIQVQTKLTYQKPDGKRICVWPVVRSEVFVNGPTAVFTGDRAAFKSRLDHIWEMENRIFIAKSPDPPVDITKQVVRRWAQLSGTNVVLALRRAVLMGAEAKPEHKVGFYFVFWGGISPDVDIVLSWEELSKTEAEVRATSTVHKDPQLGSDYIGEEPAPDQR